MKVRELESEFVLGQKWAVECERYSRNSLQDDNVEFEETRETVITTHYQVGKTAKCLYMDYDVRSIRVVHDEIYISVKEEIQDSDENPYCQDCQKESCFSCDIATYGKPHYWGDEIEL